MSLAYEIGKNITLPPMMAGIAFGFMMSAIMSMMTAAWTLAFFQLVLGALAVVESGLAYKMMRKSFEALEEIVGKDGQHAR